MNLKSTQRRIHVVAIPYPAQGHINPMLQLCLQLVPRGFCFTFVNTEHTHHRMLKQQSQDHHHHQHIQMVCIEGGLPPELHGFKATRAQGLQAAQLLRTPFENLLSSLINNSNNSNEIISYSKTTTKFMDMDAPSIILSDILLGWTQDSANTFGLPRVGFWCASASTLSTLLYMIDLAEKNLKIDLHNDGILLDIPGVPPVHVNLLPKLWDTNGSFTTMQSQLAKSALGTMDEVKCLILNTFFDLEGSVIEALSRRVPIIEVGPLMPCQYISPKEGGFREAIHTLHEEEEEKEENWFNNRRLSLFEEDGSCLKWLQQQKEDSVLFISFGSISVRNDEQMLELARAFLATNCRFIWIRRPKLKDNICKIYDTTFVNTNTTSQVELEITRLLTQMESKGQGVAVEWAPQLEVLAHPAVAGFLTHCGWNSIMESVVMGIPLLCWADTGERMSNQRLVVDFWGCGVDMDVKRRTLDNIQDYDKQGAIVCSDEIQSVIKGFMMRPSTIVNRAKELKHGASIAFSRASTYLDKFGESFTSLNVQH